MVNIKETRNEEGQLHSVYDPDLGLQPAVITRGGTKKWYHCDQLHNDDGPAYVSPKGVTKWYRHGKLHNENGPALINLHSKVWYYEGLIHRDDGPASTSHNGKLEGWYRHGKSHRIGGPAFIDIDGGRITREIWRIDGVETREDGPSYISDDIEEWRLNGEYHRIGGPAKIFNGNIFYYQYGKLHRDDGPAVILVNGYKSWFIEGVFQHCEKTPSNCLPESLYPELNE